VYSDYWDFYRTFKNFTSLNYGEHLIDLSLNYSIYFSLILEL
jgi:hypothetical protein